MVGNDLSMELLEMYQGSTRVEKGDDDFRV